MILRTGVPRGVEGVPVPLREGRVPPAAGLLSSRPAGDCEPRDGARHPSRPGVCKPRRPSSLCCAFNAWNEPSKAAVDAAVCGYLWVHWLKDCGPQDMPGHSSFGKGLPHLTIAACGGVLDPTQDATYEMLTKFLAEMARPTTHRFGLFRLRNIVLEASETKSPIVERRGRSSRTSTSRSAGTRWATRAQPACRRSRRL